MKLNMSNKTWFLLFLLSILLVAAGLMAVAFSGFAGLI